MKARTQKEQDQLLQTILDYRFFNPWRNFTKVVDDRSLRLDAGLELYITSTCNQKCEYCYLQKYPQLYPAEYNKPDLILHNLDILCKYLIINGYSLPMIDFYSGEIWHTQFGLDVLEMVYQYVLKGLQVDYILITSNCSFVTNPEYLQKIQQYINKFNGINCPLVFSISVDGKVIDNMSRPRNDKNNTYDDEFYELLGAFASANQFLFHPMVSSHNVKFWKENYKWWMDYIRQYGYDRSAVMTLEVRNADWTDENIADYCDFLDYLMQDYLKCECKGDIGTFARAVACMRQAESEPHLHGYIPWALGQTDTFTGCTIANNMFVRLGDLAICPCHRTAYKEYLYGHFKVENDVITGIEANNTAMAIQVLMANILTTTPICTECIFNETCLHGCLGSQLESGQDPFFPLENICKLFKAKYSYIFRWYREHGVIDYWKKNFTLEEPNGAMIAKLLRINDQLEAEENGMGTL